MNRLDSDELKALYDGKYARQLDSRDHERRLRCLVDKIELKSSFEVVDFGCGSGALLDLLFRRVRSYTGVDFSPAFIEIAGTRLERLGVGNATFVCSSIEDFCATHRESFDAAFAFDFSEHVYDDEWIAILECIRGSLKRSGRLYLHTPNAEFVLEIMKARNFMLRQSREHIAVRNRDQNARLLERAGYSVRRAEFVPHYNVQRLVHRFSNIPLVGRYLKARIFIEARVRP